MLYAVGLTESGRKDSLQPHAMNIGGKAYFADGVADALVQFEAARKRGISLIDIGCMQINHHFHGDQFPSVAAMFDPHANVDYAARFLKSLRSREGAAGPLRWRAITQAPTTTPPRSAMCAR